MQLYVFLVRRPIDSEAWATVFTDRARAEEYPHRVSEVVPVGVIEYSTAGKADEQP